MPPCTLREVPLEDIRVEWDGPALGRKAVAYPRSRRVYLDRRFWSSIPTVEGRAAILAHERAHVEGARCESCADRRAGEILRREGYTTPRDGMRTLITTLEHRDYRTAAEDLEKGFGIDDEPTSRYVEGWRNGQRFTLRVVQLAPGFELEAERVAPAFRAAIAEASAQGISVAKYNSGWRSYEKQAELYAKYQAGGPLAAKPGYSNHQAGESADLSFWTDADYDRFAEVANRHGIVRDVPSERWHFTFKGRSSSAAPLVAGGAGLLLLVAVAAMVLA